MNQPTLIFETSWEICNQIDGVHTVISGKAKYIAEKYQANQILIGPDLRRTEEDNPEFDEDNSLMPEWRKHAKKAGLRFRIGRWRTEGSPIAVLLDFSNFISKKNEIFTRFWERFQLDSMAGGWDYIEAAMFGYAAGKLIENYCDYNLSAGTKVLAQFHDWQTGAGILYLKEQEKNIATLFTIHSPVLSKTISERGDKLFSLPEAAKPFELSRNYDVISHHSLEYNAAHNADIFTVNGEFIANQVKYFLQKEPDYLTPNGLNPEFFSKTEDFEDRRKNSREKIIAVAESLIGKSVSENARLLFTSGEYDFYNKGTKLIIDAVANLNESHDPDKQAFVFMLFPADHYGAREDLKAAVAGEGKLEEDDRIMTHFVHQSDYDDITHALREKNLHNKPEDKVNIIYCPAFLDGSDGIFNIPYHELIAGFDYGLFPYYYEAWGYTAHETLANGIPVCVSSLSGFGNWLENHISEMPSCIRVLNRKDNNNTEIIGELEDIILNCAPATNKSYHILQDKTLEIAEKAKWSELIKAHFEAYEKAIEKIREKGDLFIPASPKKFKEVRTYRSNQPIWRDIAVQSTVSESLKGLEEIADNLWWAWNPQAQEMFRYISGSESTEEVLDPKTILKSISYEQVERLEKDDSFMKLFNSVYREYKDYMSVDFDPALPSISYFSMEYGITDLLQIYSGGLGILAGDYLKQASDSRYNMHAVGLFYHQGYFTQQIGINGEQNAVYESQKFMDLPAELIKDNEGNAKIVQLALPGRTVNIQVWKIKVGRIQLFLLDTDRDDNNKEDRAITHRLYGGDNEDRLKQEMILGIGGIRALNMLGLSSDLYHINEGHAAFIGFERLTYHMNKYKMTFDEAMEVVRASSLFTTHTPVPAGHDSFSEDLLMTYMGHYPDRLRISKEDFVNLGRQRKGKKSEDFSMSVLGVNLSQEVNGVSKLHGDVTKTDIFPRMWEGYFPEEFHIGYVTNGVHQNTWTAPEWQKHFKTDEGTIDFSRIQNLSDDEIRTIRTTKKSQLFDFIKERLDKVKIRRQENPKVILNIQNALNPDALTIGFARRFATYKRGDLLFRDIERLEKILNKPEKPVQLIFAGKAHPKDAGGQAIIKKIIDYSKQKAFIGKVIFLEDYKMSLAKHLVQGVDIWLNTPIRPLEASGTSGMKAVMNGVMNFSVLDGWWVEGYKKGAGWALPLERTYQSQELQDDLDAAMIYQMLESDIIPLFYKNRKNGFSDEWIAHLRKCVSEIAPDFTTLRMITDYNERFYGKLHKRNKALRADSFKEAQRIAAKKTEIQKKWDNIETENIKLSDPVQNGLVPGEKYFGELILDLKNLPAEYVGAEIIISEADSEGKRKIVDKQALKLTKTEGSKAFFEIEMLPPGPGNYSYAFRIYPAIEGLPHRQDLDLVKWV